MTIPKNRKYAEHDYVQINSTADGSCMRKLRVLRHKVSSQTAYLEKHGNDLTGPQRQRLQARLAKNRNELATRTGVA